MAKTYGVLSTKGGIGKTTLTANLGGILADMNQRVLLIDADFQQSLSSYYKIDKLANHGLKEAVIQADASKSISSTNILNLDIICSNDPKQELITWLRQSSTHVQYLKALINQASPDYDYIFIDSQGAAGILQESVILASDTLLSPITTEYLSAKEFFRGTVQMLERMIMPKAIDSTPLPPLLGIINRLNRTSDSKAILESLRRNFSDVNQHNVDINILNSTIPEMSVYNKAAGQQIPAHRFEVKRKGPTRSAHDTILAIIHELEPDLINLSPVWA